MKYSETKIIITNVFKEKLKPYSYKKYKYGFEKVRGNNYHTSDISIFDYDDFQQATFTFSIGIIPL